MLNINLPLENRKEKINFIVEFSGVFKKLREKEKDVLKELLVWQDALNYNILLDYDIKIKVRENLKISEHNFNNLLSSLRKKNIIIDNKITRYYLDLVNQDGINITFDVR